MISSKSGRWPGSCQPRGRDHPRDANPSMARVYAAGVLLDSLRLGAGGLDGRRRLSMSRRHRRGILLRTVRSEPREASRVPRAASFKDEAPVLEGDRLGGDLESAEGGRT